MEIIMKTGKKNLLLAIGIIVVIAAVFISSHSQYDAFVKKFDFHKAQARGLPMLVEFGFQACPPCKLMKPVLESLDKEYSEDFAIGYIDTINNRETAKQYNIEAAPTLIFYDKDGNELARVIGYTSKEDILKKWKELGVLKE
ncbi:MAG: thioredoxin family protein [Planctomycetes bacterium]|nr:thioredoxin family protein [Planctomycetota bacterium]